VEEGSPTRVGSPTPTPSPGSLQSVSTVFPDPETVLHTAEIEQSRRMAITGVAFNVVAFAASPLVRGHPTAKLVAVVSFALAVLNNAWLWYAAASPGRYTRRKLSIYFALASVLNAGIICFLGVFGAVVSMFVLNIFTACLGYDRRIAFATLVGSLVPYVALAAPIAAGWIDDPGLMAVTPYVGTFGRAIMVASFAAFLCLVYAQARTTRELIVTSLAQRDAAVRTASHREALLLEARRDLEIALQAGELGRFTDQTLGSFKLGPVLARGGMGEVYEAVHVKDGSPAAVKMLLPEVLARGDFVRRFLREVRVAASLDSPHVVRVLEVGDETAPLPYLAMERLEGEDLSHILRKKERLDGGEVIDLVRQVGEGLRVATAAGIVHRDLKPQNLFLARGPRPTWKILDFGISKLVDQTRHAHRRRHRRDAAIHGARAGSRRASRSRGGPLRARRRGVSRPHRLSAVPGWRRRRRAHRVAAAHDAGSSHGGRPAAARRRPRLRNRVGKGAPGAVRFGRRARRRPRGGARRPSRRRAPAPGGQAPRVVAVARARGARQAVGVKRIVLPTEPRPLSAVMPLRRRAVGPTRDWNEEERPRHSPAAG